VFESYAKILHQIEAHYASVDNPLSQEEERTLNIPQHSPVRTLILDRREFADRRVRWRELADFLDVPFAAGITWNWFRAVERQLDWPRYLSGPGEGYLEEEEYTELVRLLTCESIDRVCYYRLAEIPYIATNQPLLFNGNIDEVREIPVQGEWHAPEYWWSVEHLWAVCSDYDLNFTIVAGPRNLIQQVLASSVLEAVEVSPHSRVDDFTPLQTKP
jgi:hypothetical protein